MWCSSFFAMQWLWSSNDYFVGKYKSNYKFCCLFMFLHLSCLGLCVKYINLGEVSLYYNYIVYNNHAQQYHCQYLKGVPQKSVITVLHLILWVFFIFSKYENFSLQLNNIYLKYPIDSAKRTTGSPQNWSYFLVRVVIFEPQCLMYILQNIKVFLLNELKFFYPSSTQCRSMTIFH